MTEGAPRFNSNFERPDTFRAGPNALPIFDRTLLHQDRTMRDLQAEQKAFSDARPLMRSIDSPQHLGERIKEEADEVLEEVVWGEEAPTHEQLTHVGDELADVMSFVFNLSNLLDIDMQEAYERKMKENREKYPADEFQLQEGVTFWDVYPKVKARWNATHKNGDS